MRSIATKSLWISLAIFMAQAPSADAHWCSNIYQTYARIVVKPERQAINVGVGETSQLMVRVRNNFPYTMRYIQLRANNPAGLSVTVTPSEAEAQNKVIYAGQETTFTLSITRDQAGSDDVADLNLEINTSVEDIGGSWRDAGNWWVDQNPTEADVRNAVQNSPAQTRGLLNADLADGTAAPAASPTAWKACGVCMLTGSPPAIPPITTPPGTCSSYARACSCLSDSVSGTSHPQAGPLW